MAQQIETPSTPTIKYGEASKVTFGTKPKNSGDVAFTVITAQSVNSSFQTNTNLKNEAGITIGSVVGDPKIEYSFTGYSDEAPALLGAIATDISTFAGGVVGGSNQFGAQTATEKSMMITGVKEDRSNEDFLSFEVTGECYPNINYATQETLSDYDAMYG